MKQQSSSLFLLLLPLLQPTNAARVDLPQWASAFQERVQQYTQKGQHRLSADDFVVVRNEVSVTHTHTHNQTHTGT